MTNKVSMESMIPLDDELAMLRAFYAELCPPKRSTSHEEEFWKVASEALYKGTSCDFVRLCGLEVKPRHFVGADSYLRAAQFSALFRKRNDVGSPDARERTALESFLEAEEACRITNRFIWGLRHGGVEYTPPLLLDVLHSAKREIRMILGPCPSIDTLPCYLGPGATTQVMRKWANARVKLGQMFACSESMLPRISQYLESMPDFIFRHPDDGETATCCVDLHPARLSFVPKSFSTFRSIAVEPWLNSFFQLGIGRVMTRRLKAFGLDLADQTANQKLALQGSQTGRLATLDLSRASDSISYQLVRELLPDDWFELLAECRSCHISYRGSVARLAKFSSMGNGFTFPLQSLIFWSLSRAVCKTLGISYVDVRSYGDDIIVPTEAYARLVSILYLLGFAVNDEKSFHDGPFRESCGADYWQGIDVRPIFLRKRPDYFDLFTLHNGLIRKGRAALASVVRRFIPPPLVLLGPDGYGDGHLIGLPFTPCQKSKHVKRGWGGFTFDTYSRVPRKYTRPHPGDYLYPSYSIYRRGNGEPLDALSSADVVPGTRGYKRLSIYTLNLTSIEVA